MNHKETKDISDFMPVYGRANIKSFSQQNTLVQNSED